MKEIIKNYNFSEIETFVEQFAQHVGHTSILTLTGSLGAGKTTFVAHLLSFWGVKKPVVSPTFTYMNVYTLNDGRIAYHFDLYRLDSLEAFEEAGFAEYLYQENSVCLIEWPEIIMPLLQKSVCHVQLDFIDFDTRKISYSCI